MIVGDEVVVHLPELRVGRVGTVIDIRIQDREWSPLVQPDAEHQYGEMGRRIYVHWNLNVGPRSPGQVVQLQENLFGGALIQSIAPLNEETFSRIVEAMRDEHNWINLEP